MALAKPLNWITYGLVSEVVMPACIAPVPDCSVQTAMRLFGVGGIQDFLRSIMHLVAGDFGRSAAGVTRYNCHVIFAKPCEEMAVPIHEMSSGTRKRRGIEVA